MYEKHFSFKYKPFELVPNPDFLFLSSTHKKAITYLDYGIKEKIGFVLLTGEIGSGKTTIMRNLIKNINGSVKLSRINNTKITSEQLISMINEDFGLDIEGKNKIRLLSDLNKFLIEQYAEKSQPILLIDEAHNFTPDLLEEIRLLSNLETDRAKLLQIILVGQPELKNTLMLPELLQLRQRINISYHLTTLRVEEVSGYIKHRLSIAGNSGAINLGGDTIKLIYKFSRGIPRLINIVCDFALLSAYTDAKKEVTDDIVRDVVSDLEMRDYWSDSHSTSDSDKVTYSADNNLLKAAGDIALRLIKLEEKVKNNLPGIAALEEKMRSMEEEISRINKVDEEKVINSLLEHFGEKDVGSILQKTAGNSALAELSDRITRLENLLLSINAGKSSDGPGFNGKKSDSEQVELLRGLLSDINKKFKSCEEGFQQDSER